MRTDEHRTGIKNAACGQLGDHPAGHGVDRQTSGGAQRAGKLLAATALNQTFAVHRAAAFKVGQQVRRLGPDQLLPARLAQPVLFVPVGVPLHDLAREAATRRGAIRLGEVQQFRIQRGDLEGVVRHGKSYTPYISYGV